MGAGIPSGLSKEPHNSTRSKVSRLSAPGSVRSCNGRRYDRHVQFERQHVVGPVQEFAYDSPFRFFTFKLRIKPHSQHREAGRSPRTRPLSSVKCVRVTPVSTLSIETRAPGIACPRKSETTPVMFLGAGREWDVAPIPQTQRPQTREPAHPGCAGGFGPDPEEKPVEIMVGCYRALQSSQSSTLLPRGFEPQWFLPGVVSSGAVVG